MSFSSALPFTYQLERTRRAHSIRIKIHPDGQVIVTAPSDCPTSFVDRFIVEHQDWVTKNLAKVQKLMTGRHKNPDEIEIFGKKYHKKIEYSHKVKVGVQIKGHDVVINPVSDTETSVARTLDQFLKSTAEKYILPRTHQLGQKMDITFRHISLKNQKTRWGSCSSEGNLNFNWRLVHNPPEVIDYVIIHELAHRREMNHSQKFWAIVRKFDPEYLKHRGWLKRHGMVLG